MTASFLSKDENTVLIFAGQIQSELLNNGTYISLHVVSLISHASFFMQRQIFSTGFASGNYRGNIILCLLLFLNHAYIAMTLWQGALSYWNTNGCCWSLNISSTDSSNFPPMRSMYEYWLTFPSTTTKLLMQGS